MAIVALVLLIDSPPPTWAILERAGEHIHDAGAFRLFMTNLGVTGNPTYPSFSDHPSLEWPAGTAHEFLLEAGIWVGARDRRANLIGVSTSVPVNEFRPGLEPVDRIYASFDGAQGTRRFGSTLEAAEADDDGDGRIDEEFLNGKDEDGDGHIDEDFVALGAQSFACEYRDDTEEAQRQLLAHIPMMLRTRQQSFTWAEGVGELDRCAVLQYHVANVGAAPLYDVLLGFFADPDVGPKAREGYWRDDRYSIESIAATFPSQGTSILRGCEEVPFEIPAVIVEDVPDGQQGAAGGDIPGLIAVLVLDHTTHPWGHRAPETVGPVGIVHLRGRASVDRTREEISDVEKYDLMASGLFMGNTTTDDHRFVMVVGPFSELPAGHSLELTVALVLAIDRAELTRTVAALMQRHYGRWLDMDGSSFTGRNGREYCLTTRQSRFCGFSPMEADHDCDEPQTRVRAHAGCRNSFIQSFCPDAPLNRCSERISISGTACRYVDFDCNGCTPNVLGGETLVRWADSETRISSRPITKTVIAGDRAVTVEWDNAAELPTAARALPPVAGYQVWRADGWTRPPGSSGPAADQWALVATLPLPSSGLPGPGDDFIIDGVDIIDMVPGPEATDYPHYAVGRYRFEDDGVLNGFAVFYDVTPFSLESFSGNTIEAVGLVPRAGSVEHVYPVDEAASTAEIRVVPNPYVESAAWDLEPTRTDPSGRKIAFTGLPDEPVRIDIFTLSGDLVRRLEHQGGRGAVDWDLLSRNGQPVVAGIYLYVAEGPGLLHRGRLVIVR